MLDITKRKLRKGFPSVTASKVVEQKQTLTDVTINVVTSVSYPPSYQQYGKV